MQLIASLAQTLVMLPSSGLKPCETIEQRMAKIEELRKQRDKLERQHLVIAQAIWNLKASWR